MADLDGRRVEVLRSWKCLSRMKEGITTQEVGG